MIFSDVVVNHTLFIRQSGNGFLFIKLLYAKPVISSANAAKMCLHNSVTTTCIAQTRCAQNGLATWIFQRQNQLPQRGDANEFDSHSTNKRRTKPLTCR